MKFSILTYISLLFVKLTFLPNLTMLGWVFFAVLVDFMTGVLKAKLNKQLLTSGGFRQTSIKCLQYIGLIVGGIIIGNSFEKQSDIVKWVNDGLLMFILYVEVYSIFENLYAMNPNSKVSKMIFKPAMRILTIGLEKNSLNKAADAAEASRTDNAKQQSHHATVQSIIDDYKNLKNTSSVILIAASLMLLSACRIIKPEVSSSFTSKDTTITNYKPVNVEVKGATVGASFNYDSAMNVMFGKWVKMLPAAQQSLNMDSLYKVFKGSLKTGEIKTITDPQTKVQLQYWVDEFGKLQMTCSSKDQTIQMMVAEITRLTKEVTKEKKVEVVKEMTWWGWIFTGLGLAVFLILLVVFVIHNIKN